MLNYRGWFKHSQKSLSYTLHPESITWSYHTGSVPLWGLRLVPEAVVWNIHEIIVALSDYRDQGIAVWSKLTIHNHIGDTVSKVNKIWYMKYTFCNMTCLLFVPASRVPKAESWEHQLTDTLWTYNFSEDRYRQVRKYDSSWKTINPVWNYYKWWNTKKQRIL